MPDYQNIFLRTSPSLHEAMKRRAVKAGTSMNQAVIDVLTGDTGALQGFPPAKGSEKRDVVLRVPPPLKAALLARADTVPLALFIHRIITGREGPVQM